MEKLADEGTTMVVVMHEMSFAQQAANRVMFMENGVKISGLIKQNPAMRRASG